MGIIEYLLTGISVSMDTLAVGLAKGMIMKKMRKTEPFIIGLFFGLGQAIMLCVGFFLAGLVSGLLTAISHWIAFSLLALVGINMIREAFEEDNKANNKMDIKSLVVLTLAMSIDSLAVGVSFAFIKGVNIWFAVLAASIVTFIITTIAVFIGNKFGNKFGKKAGVIGGIIFILLGVKVLLEFFGIL